MHTSAWTKRTFVLVSCPRTLAPATFAHGSKAGMDFTRPVYAGTQLLHAARPALGHLPRRYALKRKEDRDGWTLCSGRGKGCLPLFAAAGNLLCSLTVFQANAMWSELLGPGASRLIRQCPDLTKYSTKGIICWISE